MAESAPDIVYGTVLSQNLSQISITVPFYLGWWALSHAFLRKALSNEELRDRARDHDIGGHIFLTTWSLFSLRLDSFVISSSPLSTSFQFLLPTSAFCATRCRVQFGGAAFSFGAAMDERKRVKIPIRRSSWPCKYHPNNGKERMNSRDCDMDVIWMKIAWQCSLGGYFWSISSYSQNVGMIHRNILAKFWLQAKYKSKIV